MSFVSQAVNPLICTPSASHADDALAYTRLYIAEALRHDPAFMETDGDTATVTYQCVGLVLLAAAHAHTRDPQQLAVVSGFLAEFTGAVISLMDCFNLWELEAFAILVEDAANLNCDNPLLLASVASCLERVWLAGWPGDYIHWLEITRARKLWTGVFQGYPDSGVYLEEFLPTAVLPRM